MSPMSPIVVLSSFSGRLFLHTLIEFIFPFMNVSLFGNGSLCGGSYKASSFRSMHAPCRFRHGRIDIVHCKKMRKLLLRPASNIFVSIFVFPILMSVKFVVASPFSLSLALSMVHKWPKLIHVNSPLEYHWNGNGQTADRGLPDAVDAKFQRRSGANCWISLVICCWNFLPHRSDDDNRGGNTNLERVFPLSLTRSHSLSLGDVIVICILDYSTRCSTVYVVRFPRKCFVYFKYAAVVAGALFSNFTLNHVAGDTVATAAATAPSPGNGQLFILGRQTTAAA